MIWISVLLGTILDYERFSHREEAGEDCMIRSFITCKLHQISFKNDEMGGVCSTHGRDEKFLKYFRSRTRMEEATSKTYA